MYTHSVVFYVDIVISFTWLGIIVLIACLILHVWGGRILLTKYGTLCGFDCYAACAFLYSSV